MSGSHSLSVRLSNTVLLVTLTHEIAVKPNGNSCEWAGGRRRVEKRASERTGELTERAGIEGSAQRGSERTAGREAEIGRRGKGSKVERRARESSPAAAASNGRRKVFSSTFRDDNDDAKQARARMRLKPQSLRNYVQIPDQLVYIWSDSNAVGKIKRGVPRGAVLLHGREGGLLTTPGSLRAYCRCRSLARTPHSICRPVVGRSVGLWAGTRKRPGSMRPVSYSAYFASKLSFHSTTPIAAVKKLPTCIRLPDARVMPLRGMKTG